MNAADTRRLYARLLHDEFLFRRFIGWTFSKALGESEAKEYADFLRTQATTRKENCYAIALRQIEGRA